MKIGVRIRPLRLADYEKLIALYRRCGIDPRVRGRESGSAFATQLRTPSNRYLGAFDGHRLVGAVLGTQDSRKGWINRLAVVPEYRRRGLARRLVRTCEKGLKSQGLRMFAALIEPSNKGSAAVFRSLGYEVQPMLYARRKLHPSI